MAMGRKAGFMILALTLTAALVAAWSLKTPPDSDRRHDAEQAAHDTSKPDGLDDAPPEVREFLERVLAELPDRGEELTDYRFQHWKREGKPTQETFGIKPIPGLDPEEVIARVMDVDGYAGHLAHVESCRSLDSPAPGTRRWLRFYQRISVPGVARVQHVLALVDAGTISGHRVVYWYLLEPETETLDGKDGARSEYNVGAWLAAPGVLGYALSTWPRRGDVNRLQWVLLTSGADGMARKVVEENIDGMARWATEQPEPSE